MPAASAPKEKDLEVRFKADQGTAIIEGKTMVPFQSLVTLILQRKVFGMFKEWGREPVIVSSELLTNLASAPQDSQENRARLITVSMGVGVIAGVCFTALTELGLRLGGVALAERDYLIVAGGVAGLALLTALLMRMKRMKRSDKLTEAIEGLSAFLGK